MTGEIKCPIGYTFALRILFHLLQCWCNTYTNLDQQRYDPLYIIIWSSLILTSLAFHHCFGLLASSLAQASPPSSLSLQNLWLALYSCNRSIKPSFILIFSTLVTWLHVISHMQWAPSSHVWVLQHIQAISTSRHVLLTQLYLWINHLCISYKHILVYLGCHSITKTK
jgi:hypothetical protein